MLFDKARTDDNCNQHIVDTVYQQNNPHEFEVILSPNFGSHFLVYKDKWILYTREQETATDISLG
jgi:hypothetical protein